MRTTPLLVLVSVIWAALSACSDAPVSPPLEDAGPPQVIDDPACDALVPEYCPLPWPSDRFLADDPATATGFRVAYAPTTLPLNSSRAPFDLTPFERMDGFSPAAHLMFMFPDVPDLARAAHHDSVERSLDPDSPIVLLDMDTGERVAHWVEHDHAATGADRTAVLIRPAARLAENRTYGVAIRGLAPAGGQPFEPSPAFRALRDGTPTTSDDVESRRARYGQLFEALSGAGVDTSELQLAWWFHTASGAASRADMLTMRDDAVARLGPGGIGCTVTSIEDGVGGNFRRVRGTVTTPSYMDSATPPARVSRGPDGPTYVEDVQVPFTVILPDSLANAPGGAQAGPLIMFGHGLLGTGDGAVSSGGLRGMAEQFGFVLGGTDWSGMAAEDVATLLNGLTNISNFIFVAERLQQGMINQIAVHRTLAGACLADPAFHAQDGTVLIDPAELYFIGGSQGGIFGGTLLTLSPDVDRGVLIVGGSNYPLMIERSTNWPGFEGLFSVTYPDRLDRLFLLNHLQMVWDYADPASYLPFTTAGLPGIGPKKVLYIIANNDAQVPNVASDIAARTAGLPVIAGSTRQPFGLPIAGADYDGSGFIAIDVGDPPVPFGNLPPPTDNGGHGAVGFSTTAQVLIDAFMRPDGRIVIPGCDGVCDPE